MVLAEHPTLPVFPRCPCPKKRLFGQSSHGVRSSFTASPTSPPVASRPKAPLLGFVAPSAHQVEGIHVPPRLPALGSADSSHAADYGAARRFSQPLSGFIFPPPSCHFQAGGAPGVLPFRGFSSSLAGPMTRRHRRALVTLLLQVAHPPFLGGGTSRHSDRYLGSAGRRLSPSSGPWSARESVRRRQATVNVPTTDLPLLGFCLLMVCTAIGGKGFRPATVALGESRLRRRTLDPLRSTACHPWRRAFSHEKTLPSRGFPPSTSSPV